MKKYLVLVFTVVHTALYGQLLFNLHPQEFPSAERGRFEYLFLDGGYSSYPVYSLKDRDGTKRHIDYSSQYLQGAVRYYPLVVSFMTSRETTDLFMNNLNEVPDFFRLEKDAVSYSAQAEVFFGFAYLKAGFIYREGWGMTSGAGVCLSGGDLFFGFSSVPEVYHFSYSVKEKAGEVDFGYRREKYTLSFTTGDFYSEIFYAGISPYDNNQAIHSVINGKEFGGKGSLSSGDYCIDGEFLYGKTTIELFQYVSPFGKLEDGKYIFYSLSGGAALNKYCKVKGGVTGMSLSAARGSYFEIWPFTFWEMFLPSRVKLYSSDINMHLPFAGITGSYPVIFQNIKVEPSCSAAYYHLILYDKIQYGEKIWDIYPFAAHYERKKYDIDDSIYGFLDLHADVIMELYSVKLKFRISQLVPVSRIERVEYSGNGKKNREKDSGPFINMSVTGYL